MDELALDAATETVDVIATLHAVDGKPPWLSFRTPTLEYITQVPPRFEWAHKSYGEFSVDCRVTLSQATRELVSVDAVTPNPQLDGGF